MSLRRIYRFNIIKLAPFSCTDSKVLMADRTYDEVLRWLEDNPDYKIIKQNYSDIWVVWTIPSDHIELWKPDIG